MPAKCQDREGAGDPVAAPARMPATSPASAPAPDPAATSPEAASSPAVVPAPLGIQGAGNDGTVWNTINPGVEAAGLVALLWIRSAKNDGLTGARFGGRMFHPAFP
ncbi:UNVERIFIED_CONTAM: hypothetical protein FKN15_031983 [Acipenser sinensis]